MSAEAIPLLRPMRVAELLDTTIRLYRKNFLTFVAIVAVVQVPLIVINGLMSVPMGQAAQEMVTFDPYDPENFAPETYEYGEPPALFPPSMGRYFLWIGLQLLVGGTLGLIATSLMTGALAWAVSERHLGQPITVGAAYRAVLRRWKSILGASLLTIGIYLVLYIVVIIPCIGQLVGIPALIFTYVCLRFVPQAVMLEEQQAGASLRRSWYLTKPHFWRVLGIIALLFIFGMLITAGPSYIISYGMLALGASFIVQTLVSTVANALLSLIYLPIRLTGETVLYYDLRVRGEGLDLEMELDALSTAEEEEEWLLPEETDDALPPSLPPAPATQEPFLTGRDWRNLAILLAVGLGLFVLCCGVYFIGMLALGALTAPMMERMMETLPTLTPMP